eukprot:gnl/TRDRNA2_/TRDRNA2_102772_c0_seq2.p1 gnl/TRDRNA2_/TRDRNA2_102772_c0~~gnl/TRDRNA2_/TRDRNA2_102772_c0_seq2.p1  ORF type:complete len:115 (+),score=4.07 gnl/TRDRNA2_/TRDRNA2_102772_c0_seq2:53-397(+)
MHARPAGSFRSLQRGLSHQFLSRPRSVYRHSMGRGEDLDLDNAIEFQSAPTLSTVQSAVGSNASRGSLDSVPVKLSSTKSQVDGSSADRSFEVHETSTFRPGTYGGEESTSAGI